jgi:hypothetical protein
MTFPEELLYLLFAFVLLAMIGSGILLIIQTFRKFESPESNIFQRFYRELWRPFGFLAGLFIVIVLGYAFWFTLVWIDFM